MTAVLDASTALALLRTEAGHERVAEMLPGSMISALNYSEVIQKLTQLGSDTAEDDAAALIALGATVVPFDTLAAVRTARLWPVTEPRGLSLADRACLALAASVPDGFAVTADEAWTRVDVGVRVEVIR